ncbi:MAG: ankyrin repeat domain-containing protein [Armatimonadetes bacterium]|nr:ankyrin repeat domain-containing protein [Armatimonadota bacterium]
MGKRLVVLILGSTVAAVLGTLLMVKLTSKEPEPAKPLVAGALPRGQPWQPSMAPKPKPGELSGTPLTAEERKKLETWYFGSGWIQDKSGNVNGVKCRVMLKNHNAFAVSDVKVRMKVYYKSAPELKYSRDVDLIFTLATTGLFTQWILPPGQMNRFIDLWLPIKPEGWRTDMIAAVEVISGNHALPGKDLHNSNSLLCFMLENSTETILKKFQEDPSLLKVRDHWKATPLQLAIMTGKVDLIDPLIKMGLDLNVITETGHNALHYATLSTPEMIAKVASLGAKANQPDFEVNSVLHLAVFMMKPEIMPALIKAGANIEDREWSGETPLLTAIRLDSEPEMLALHKLGAKSVGVVDRGFRNVYILACMWRKRELFELMKKNKIGDFREVPENGSTVAHAAANYDFTAGLQFLLDNGVDINVADPQGITPYKLHKQDNPNNVTWQQTEQWFNDHGIKS